MSRSYRHTYCIKDHTKGFKELFNRRIRRTGSNIRLNNEDIYDLYDNEIPNYGAYKKANESYDISDYCFYYYDWQDFKSNMMKNDWPWFDSEEECYEHWRSHYVFK